MAKTKRKRDAEREDRIHNEAIADCHDREERIMGWYGYLENEMRFPFTAKCTVKRAISPLRVRDKVEVVGLADVKCQCEFFVTIRWADDNLAVPLSQLRPVSATDESTQHAVEDWHYWTEMGYEL